MTNTAIYARYSSDQQRDASIEDQLRLCRERAAREGWIVTEVYTDHAASGASLMRRGIQQLLRDANAGKFEIVIAEALDRLSRDQADIAGIYKRLRFEGVGITTLSEGEIGDLHIGLKGTMNAIFLKDLADKTRRGLRGRVEAGKSGGGNSYGYDVVKSFDADGALIRGNRCINEDQATIVRRIFNEYAAGASSKTIAKKLNREGISGPAGKGWGPSTIHGNSERGTGILNNELYIGRLVWNRLRYIKDPDTGRRVSRPNPEAALIVKDVPEMRLLDQDLWDKVKARQRSLSLKQDEATAEGRKVPGFWDRKRPRSLFSGLLKCGECGGGITLINRNYLGCATARNKGSCDHLSAIRRDALEETVLSGLQHCLMDPVLTEAFCAEYAKHANRLRQNVTGEQDAHRAELEKIARDQERLVDAIMSGVPAAKIKERMEVLETRQKELTALLAVAAKPAPVFLHPKMSERYRAAVGRLRDALSDTARRPEAVEIIRALVDFITLTPRREAGAKAYEIDIEGDLAEILRLAAQQPPQPRAETQQIRQSIKLVAGAGFEPTTFRL